MADHQEHLCYEKFSLKINRLELALKTVGSLACVTIHVRATNTCYERIGHIGHVALLMMINIEGYLNESQALVIMKS